jgi:hypothetical protein
MYYIFSDDKGYVIDITLIEYFHLLNGTYLYIKLKNNETALCLKYDEEDSLIEDYETLYNELNDKIA